MESTENTTPPKPNSGIAKSLILLIILVLFLTLILLVKNQKLRLHPSDKYVTIQTNPKEIREEIFNFLTSTFYSEQEPPSVNVLLNCRDSSKDCIIEQPANLPAYAWSMLFLAQSTKEYENKDSTKNSISKKHLENAAQNWSKLADEFNEIFSLHQIYETWKLTGQEFYINKIVENYPNILYRARYFIERSKAGEKQITNSYLISTLARQIALMTDAYLSKHGNYKKDETIYNNKVVDVISLSNSLIELANKDMELGYDSIMPPMFTGKTVEWAQTSCFPQWAKTGNMLLINNFTEYEELGYLPLLKETSGFFRNLSVKLDKEEPYFLMLQAILPCLHSLNDYRNIQLRMIENSERFPEEYMAELLTKNDIDSLFVKLTTILLKKFWHHPHSTCHHKKGGFFTESHSKEPSLLCTGTKNLVDNSWLAFIMNPELDYLTFEVRVSTVDTL